MWARITHLAVVLCLFVGLQQPAVADDASAAEAARELMAVTGAGELGIQVMNQMIDALSKDPRIPPQFIEKFKARAKPEDLVDMVVPLYIKHMSEADMRAAIVFYKTPAGQRIIKATPLITQESMAVGQQWGLKMVTEIQKEMGTPKK